MSNGNIITNSVRSLVNNITPYHRRKLILMSLLIFVSALLDVIGLAAVLPLIKAGADPDAIHTNQFLNFMYSKGEFSSEKYFVLFLIFTLLIYFLFKTVFGVFVNWLQARLNSKMTVHIARQQFSKYFMLDYIDYKNIKSSLMIRNILYNPTSYTQWIIQPLMMLLSEMFIVILIVTGIAYYDLFLFVFVLITIGPATYLVYMGLRKQNSKVGVGIDRVFPFAISSLTEAITGYIDIKLADKLQRYRNRYLMHYKNFQDLQQKAYLLNQIPLRSNEVIAMLGIILIFIYVMFVAPPGTDVIVHVGAFAVAAYRLMPSINRILNSLMYLNKNQVSIDNLYAFDDLIKEEAGPEIISPVIFNDRIFFDNISFSFPGAAEPVLNGISLEVKKGQTVGFIGSSGSGKTTLMNILLRFYTETSGGLVVDGVKLTPEHTGYWRSLIGYVKQDVFLVDSSIEENITLGDPGLDMNRLESSVRNASLVSFVESLPEKLNSPIGEHGSKLSGGQRQRIGIARSLYRNAEILVFDEATSALDPDTEKEVTDAIDALSSTNKTIFIIAHRITTLRNCDKIFELKEGRIAGEYTYDQIKKRII